MPFTQHSVSHCCDIKCSYLFRKKIILYTYICIYICIYTDCTIYTICSEMKVVEDLPSSSTESQLLLV